MRQIFPDKPKLERVIEAWKELEEKDRQELLPYLLHNITGWRAFSGTPQHKLNWLEESFKKVDVPFRPPLYEPQKTKYDESIFQKLKGRGYIPRPFSILILLTATRMGSGITTRTLPLAVQKALRTLQYLRSIGSKTHPLSAPSRIKYGISQSRHSNAFDALLFEDFLVSP